MSDPKNALGAALVGAKKMHVMQAKPVPKVASILQDATTAISNTMRHLGAQSVGQPLTSRETSQLETLLKSIKLIAELEQRVETSLALQSLSDAELRQLLERAANPAAGTDHANGTDPATASSVPKEVA